MNRRARFVAVVLAVVVALIGASVLAGAAPGSQHEREQHRGPAYVCLKDRVGADQAGPCPICKQHSES